MKKGFKAKVKEILKREIKHGFYNERDLHMFVFDHFNNTIKTVYLKWLEKEIRVAATQ